MSNEGPKPYNVVYDADAGALEYSFQSGYITIPEASVNAITSLTGQVTATGPGAATATVANSAVIAKVLTGYVSGSGTVAATDTILQAIQKLNGNTAAITPSAINTEILYMNGTVPTGDSHFVWDQTNHRMGINGFPGSYPIEIYAGSNGAYYFAENLVSTSAAGFLAQDINSHSVQLAVFNTTFGAPLQGTSAVFANGVPLGLYSTSGSISIAAGGTTPQLTVGTNGVATFTQAPSYPLVTTAGTGTITPNALNAVTISVPVSGAVTIDGPTNGYDGQKLTLRIINDGSHSVTLATGSGNFSFGTTIASYTNSVSTIDYIGVIYNLAATVWHVVSLSQGF